MSEFKLNRRESLALALGGLFALGSRGVSAQGQAQLTFWSVRLNTPELQAALLPLLAQFEAENPGIKVTNEPVSGQLVYPKFIAAVQGQQMPDVAEAYSYHPIQFAALDQMEPMDDIIAEWEKNGQLANLVNEFAYKKFLWHDHYWGLPYNVDPRAIYYRKDLLAAKGIQPPTDWDSFQAAVLACHDPANGVYGVAFPAGDFHISQQFYHSFMFQAGGGLLNAKGELIFGTDAKDANVQALTYLTDFATKHKVTPEGIAEWNTDDAHIFFAQGRAAFAMGTGQMITRVTSSAPEMLPNVGILDTLQGPKAKLANGFYNSAFVWKYSPNVEAAKTFIRWFTTPGRLEPIYAAAPGSLWPVYKSELNTPRIQSNPLLVEMLTKVIPFTTDAAYPSSGIPEMGVIDGEKLYAAPVNEVVLGVKTPEQAVLDAHARMAAVFAA